MQIELTERAAAEFKRIAEKEGMAGAVMRIVARDSGCAEFGYSILYDKKPARPTDFQREYFGVEIRVDPDSARYVDNARIDYVAGGDCEGFVFINPNVSKNHGCGGSFSR